MNVRVLDPSDWLLWKTLRLRALAESPDAFGRTFDEESRFDDPVWKDRLSGQGTLVAEIEGRALGIASFRLDPEDRRLGHLFAMWAAPEARGQGLGRAILGFALGALKDLGAAEAELTVTEGNLAALALYESSGFADTGRREPLREGSHLRVIRMRASL